MASEQIPEPVENDEGTRTGGPTDEALAAAHAQGVAFRQTCLTEDHTTVSELEYTFNHFRSVRTKVRMTEGGGLYNATKERPLWRAFLAGICGEASPVTITPPVNEV